MLRFSAPGDTRRAHGWTARTATAAALVALTGVTAPIGSSPAHGEAATTSSTARSTGVVPVAPPLLAPMSTTTTTTPAAGSGDAPPAEAPADEPPPPASVPPPSRGSAPTPLEPAPALLRSLRAQLVAARRELSAAIGTRDDAANRAASIDAELAALRAALEELRARRAELVDRLERARNRLAGQAVAAYTGERLERVTLLAEADDVNDLVRRLAFLGAAMDQSRRVLGEYRAARRAAGAAIAGLLERVAGGEAALALARDDAAVATAAVAELQVVVDALAAGSLVALRGFVFPVAGPRRFSNDFGAPRMTGTALAHPHQGTDIFAPYGTPLVAVERGVVTRVGTDRLGGLKLWLVGASGHRYYYAHTSGYAPGLAEGQVVEAGTTLAFVGDSGNAKGTSPHVHFQIHPPNSGPVNPYPLLRAVDAASGGWRPTPTTSAAPRH